MVTEQLPSTRPYLVRALYEWCTDNGFTPYVAVAVDDTVQVPREFVKNGEIVLNVSFDATQNLEMGNEFIRFKARFGGVARDIVVPLGRVVAIYARENGQGMAFPHPSTEPAAPSQARTPSAAAAPESAPTGSSLVAVESTDAHTPTEPPPRPPQGTRPSLKRIK